MHGVTIQIVPGPQARPLVDPFYEKHRSSGRARDEDVFFLAMKGHQLVGCVRFCVEQGTAMLRSMMVETDLRQQGVGLRLLHEFQRYLDERSISSVYCLPYAHLEEFYGKIGFQVVAAPHVPDFLVKRMHEYNQDGSKNIFMMRRL